MKKLLIWIIALLLISSASAYQMRDITNATIAYQTFDDLTGVAGVYIPNVINDSAFGFNWGDNIQHNFTGFGANGFFLNKTDAIVNYSAVIAGADTSGFISESSAYDNLARSQDFSFTFWYKHTSGVTSIGQWGAGTENTKWTIESSAGGAGIVYWCDSWIGVTLGMPVNWEMWTVTWNEADNNVTVYRNETPY